MFAVDMESELIQLCQDFPQTNIVKIETDKVR